MRQRIVFWLFIAAYLYFWIGGNVSYLLANQVSLEHYDFSYNLDFWGANLFAGIALACFLAGYLMFARVGRQTGSGISEQQGSRKTDALKIALSVVFCLGTIGFLLMMRQYGWRIPMFAEHADEFRTDIDSGLPQLLYFNLVAAALLAYGLLQSNPQNRRFLKLTIVTSLGLVFLGGSRSMFFTPLLIMAIDLWRRRSVKTIWLAVSGVIAFAAVFLIGILRLGSDLERGIYLLRFVTDVAPEFREFAKLLVIVPSQEPYLYGQIFTNSAVILMPGKLLALIGIDKAALWHPFGEHLKNLFGYDFLGGGLRAGLIAEYYANFGLLGIIGGFWLAGPVVRLIEIALARVAAVGRMLMLMIGFSIATSVLFTLDAVVYKIVAVGIGWGLFAITHRLFSSQILSVQGKRPAEQSDSQTVTIHSH